MDTLGRVARNLGVMAGLLLSSGGVATSAMAGLITYNFTGDVTGVSPQLASQFHTSQSMSGSITFDLPIPPNTNPPPNMGSDGDVQNFKAMIGTYTATMGPSGTLLISVGTGGIDFYATVNSPNGNNVNFLAPREFDIHLHDPNNFFTSNALPNPAPSVASFASTPFRLLFGPEGSGTSVWSRDLVDCCSVTGLSHSLRGRPRGAARPWRWRALEATPVSGIAAQFPCGAIAPGMKAQDMKSVIGQAGITKHQFWKLAGR